jgi:hypothetical protein
MTNQILRGRLVALLGAALVGFMACSGPALAQQKTAKACQDEWRANKDANQAAGITEKAYVDKCRAGGAAATPGATPAATTTTAPAPGAAAPEQKSAKACQDEWRGNKAAYQAGGITEKAYVDKCRAGEAVAIPTVPPAATPASAPAATPAATPAVKPAPAPKPAPAATATAATGANEFPQEALAKAHCPTDTVVWANLDSKIYHFSGTKSYGTTKEGAYMCEKDALGQGVRAAKNEKHP